MGRGTLALSLGVWGSVVAGVITVNSSGRLFFHEIGVPVEHRVWRGSVFSYVFWRHGIPWGVSNGIINAFLAVPFFPGNPGDGQDIASPLSISLDIFFTSLILCFVVSLSAAPHALVDTRLGLISASESAYSPARKGWVGWFLLFSVGVALGTMVGLKAVGIEGLVVRWFIPWKGLAAGAIAGIAATISPYISRIGPEKAALFGIKRLTRNV